MDIVDSKTRSRMMSNIKGKNTKPEMVLRRALHQIGFRYVLHDKRLPGKPDMVFPKYRSVVFVHGCFWHQHQGCKNATMPSTRPDFWKNKLRGNVVRDRERIEELKYLGWRVLVVWECELSRNQFAYTVENCRDWLLAGRD
ncbi:very short patch repair endonuclease [Thalassospira sp. ER-Se-21-Dark]|uniref:very short patch repair endonuclease n=1 Tax=Thalassospira sp. ER-Se-21-Dark TaxID=2585190 RepID=UPI001B313614|nr:very short patch repair endonuclease [Thalassospira sp. ER-Se-21-Dark]MBP3127366.1 DNA mismatch endonuclease Vsr [Thalassospira sp. ER-Se-21-Dark]